ncbi:hypothetical protein SAMN04489708_11059 [Paracidovorax cattleyae]|uniref:Uncharacterized protein n=2 Tax=Paracidovorax cattleyae TaxID=80868 RepID=A0A1H0RH05_9BURK|nr:hypothetical protein SAMN04489708_11059 [Paracidovorax cattleyae]
MINKYPTAAERLTSAGASSDLTVSLDKRGDVDYLIASGKTPAVIGRRVYQLMTEWDSCAKPRSLTSADIELIAQRLPRIKVQKHGKRGVREVEALDLLGARAAADAWLAEERRRVLQRLPSLRHLVDEHAGLLAWVAGRGINEPRTKLLDVLGWWADRRCPVCQGTKERDGQACKVCRGSGERQVPHGTDGLRISEHIAHHVCRARSGSRAALKQLPAWKNFAAAKC